MKEFKLDDDVKVNETAEGKGLPAKATAWDKLKGVLFKEIDLKGILLKEIDVKGFLFQEIDLNQPVKITMSPKTEKVFGEIHDFLFQEVKFPELHDFFFKEINIFNWFRKKDNK